MKTISLYSFLFFILILFTACLRESETNALSVDRIILNTDYSTIISNGIDEIFFTVIGVNSNGTEEEVLASLYMNDIIFNQSSFKTNLAGSYEFYAQYHNLKSNTISILAADLKSLGFIVEQDPYRTIYGLGEDFDITGFKLYEYFENDIKKPIDNNLIELNNYNSLNDSYQDIILSYKNFEYTFTIKVLSKEITGINILSYPNKLSYKKNELFSISGMDVEFTLSDNTSSWLNSYHLIISGFDSSIIGKQTITASYGKFKVEFEVEILNELEYAGQIYQGKNSLGDGEALLYQNSQFTIYSPSSRYFTADGYFEISGVNRGIGASKYLYLRIKKDDTDEETYYFLEGNFKERLWLRYGAGDYTVTIHRANLTSNQRIKEDYDGDILSWEYFNPTYQFNIKNTRDEDGRFLYPSYFIQSDNITISDISDDWKHISNIKDKARQLHNYVGRLLYYDDDSLLQGQRKKQDAISTLNNKTGVCEGYTSLYVALLRSQGVEAKAIGGYVDTSPHAWANVLAEDNVWYFVDANWGDPGKSYEAPGSGGYDDDPMGNNLRYNYFWLNGNTGINNDHRWDSDRSFRTINSNNLKKNFISSPAGMF